MALLTLLVFLKDEMCVTRECLRPRKQQVANVWLLESRRPRHRRLGSKHADRWSGLLDYMFCAFWEFEHCYHALRLSFLQYSQRTMETLENWQNLTEAERERQTSDVVRAWQNGTDDEKTAVSKVPSVVSPEIDFDFLETCQNASSLDQLFHMMRDKQLER